jgi:uncharacterized membrane protein
MSLRRPGPLALALAIIGRGVLTLVTKDFAEFWQPIPSWLQGPTFLAVAGGALLAMVGVGLFYPRIRTACAWGLAVYALIWAIARSTEVFVHPARVVSWESFCEALSLFLGLFILAAGFARASGRGSSPLTSESALRRARALFGACLVVFGIAHFAYAEFSAEMVPEWLPAHTALVYLTGVAHAAAGLAILTRRFDRLGATLEASMLGLFIAIVHLPSLWMTPAPKWAATAPEQWNELLIALAVAGAAGTVAESLRKKE